VDLSAAPNLRQMIILSFVVGSFVYFTITTLTEHLKFFLLTTRKRVTWQDDNAQIPFAAAHHFPVFPDVISTMVFFCGLILPSFSASSIIVFLCGPLRNLPGFFISSWQEGFGR